MKFDNINIHPKMVDNHEKGIKEMNVYSKQIIMNTNRINVCIMS
jgi:hypothetical protein